MKTNGVTEVATKEKWLDIRKQKINLNISNNVSKTEKQINKITNNNFKYFLLQILIAAFKKGIKKRFFLFILFEKNFYFPMVERRIR